MKHHSPLSKRSVYSFRCSVAAVECFIDSYARVCNFVAKKCGMANEDLRNTMIRTFMYENNRWNCFRETLKYIDRHGLYDETAFLERQDFIKYLTAVQSLVTDDLIDSGKLDKRVEKL